MKAAAFWTPVVVAVLTAGRGVVGEPAAGAGAEAGQQEMSPGVVNGHAENTVTPGAEGATISGGGGSLYGRLFPNRVTDVFGTVAGGMGNQAGDGASTASNCEFATVGGGVWNTAHHPRSTVAGGSVNTARGDCAAIGGGNYNTARGFAATIPGGQYNMARGDYSFAAGRRAQADHPGAFVWGDSTDADVNSTGEDQFVARASGGIWFYSNRQATTGVHLARGSGAWSSASDRNAKADFQTIDGRQVLDRLAQVPVQTWSYKSQDPSIRHLGPAAQDFYAAFGLGEDNKHISTVDADGVALAAIQGLHQLLKEKDAELSALKKQNRNLAARLSAVETALAGLARTAKKPAE